MTTKQEKNEAIESLRALFPPGSTAHTILRHVSRSGMSRAIDVYKLAGDDARRCSRLVSEATGITFSEKREALQVGGCGMDMGFHVVYELSHALYPDGFECIGDTEGNRCPSNDHSNGDRDYTPHHRLRPQMT